jgi:hypothetical protein
MSEESVVTARSPVRPDLLQGKVALVTGGATGLGLEIDPVGRCELTHKALDVDLVRRATTTVASTRIGMPKS